MVPAWTTDWRWKGQRQTLLSQRGVAKVVSERGGGALVGGGGFKGMTKGFACNRCMEIETPREEPAEGGRASDTQLGVS